MADARVAGVDGHVGGLRAAQPARQLDRVQHLNKAGAEQEDEQLLANHGQLGLGVGLA